MASTAVVFDILARDNASAKFDHLGNSVDGTSTKMSKFTGLMKTAGKAAAYGLGAGLVIAGGAAVKFAEGAAQDEQAANLLAGALQRNAGATDKQIAATERWITAQGKAFGVADDDLRPALSRLVTATHDVGKAQDLASLAMDASAATGKSLATVSEALMKAQNGQVSSLSRLGINTKNAAGETLSMTELTKRMSDQFGGAASEKAETLQGKMDRLKLMMSETGEAIGYKLIPVATKLADWITSTGVPAVQKFIDQMHSGKGAGGDFADVLDKARTVLVKVGSVLLSVAKFALEHKTAVVALAGAYLAYKTVMIGVEVVQAISLIRLKALTVGTVENKVITIAASAASKAWAATQWLLNAALTANPIGLVIVAVAALAAGFVIAYKKSETFRGIVNKAWELLKKFIGFTPLGALILNFNQIKAAVDAVVGAVQSLVSWIGKLDLGKLKGAAGVIPGLGFLKRGAAGGNSVDVGNPGAALIESIVKGIDKGKVKLATVLDKLKDFIQKHQDKLADLLSQRAAMVDAFKGFASSIFSTDLSVGEGEAPKGIAALLAFQKQQRAKAEQLKGDVQSLIGKGISKDLLTQLQNAGEAGEEQIHLLASGTVDEIRQANEDNAATLQALQDAGLAAAKAQGLEAQIQAEENAIKLADTIKGKLQELLDEQDKNTVVELYLDGHKILWSLKKIKKQNGGHLGLGDKDPD